MKKSFKATIFGVAALASSFLAPQVAQATTGQTASIKASVEETLSLTLSKNSMLFELDTPDLYTNSMTVTGRTNSAGGYTISFNANNDYNDLKHFNSLIDASIASLQGSAMESNFPNKSWGYSIDDSDYLFKKIPLASKNIFVTSEPGESVNGFTVGIKGGNDLPAGDYENELIFTIIANPLISSSSSEDGQDEPLVYDERGRAKAILGTNGNLNFVFNENDYTIGETYTDNKGETEIAAVYQVPINSGLAGYDPNVAWYADREQIYSVNIDESFRNFKPTSLTAWFYYASNLNSFTNMQNLDTSEVVRMNRTFSNAGANNEGELTLDLSSWDVGNLKNMQEMFYCAFSKAENLELNLNNWDVSNVKNMRMAFYDFGRYSTGNSELSANNWTARNVEDIFNVFYGVAENAQNFELNLNNLYLGKVTSLTNMMRYVGYHSNNLVINMDNFSAPMATSAKDMFNNVAYHNSASVDANLTNWNLANVEDAETMFYYFAAQSKAVDLDVSGWNTPKLKNMKQMFQDVAYSSPVVSIDVTGLDTENVTTMNRAFQQVGYYPNYNGVTGYSWEIKGLPSWDVSNVEDMSLLFQDAARIAKNVTLDIHGWDVNAANILYMFQGFAQGESRNGIEHLYLNASGWDVSGLTDISSMFASSSTCSYGDTCVFDLSDWNTSTITNTMNMFYFVGHDAKDVTIDVSGWDVSNITNMQSMFSCAGYNSESFYVDTTGWNLNPGVNKTDMFSWAGYKSGYVAPF